MANAPAPVQSAQPVQAPNTAQPAVPAQDKAQSQPKKASRVFENQFDKVLHDLGVKHGVHGEDGGAPADKMPSFGEITERTLAREAGKPAKPKEAPEKKLETAPEPAEHEAREEKPPPQKEKLKVGDQEFELDSDQLKRFAQKGIHYEKKGVEIAKYEKAVEAREIEVQQQEHRQEALLQALEKNPGAVLEHLFGEKAFEMIESWAGQKVQTIMEYEKNPQQKAIDLANARALAAEQQLQQHAQKFEAEQVEAQSKQLVDTYTKTITEALDMEGVPRTDFTAAEMAAHMQRAADRKIDYTPQQLAQIVKEDNTVRVRAMTDGICQKIDAARKTNDFDTVVKCGKQLADMFGDGIVYALGKYHLAKLQRGQPNQPREILEQPRMKTTEPDKKKGYMKWEDVEAKRKRIVAAMERGESVPEDVWEREF